MIASFLWQVALQHQISPETKIFPHMGHGISGVSIDIIKIFIGTAVNFLSHAGPDYLPFMFNLTQRT